MNAKVRVFTFLLLFIVATGLLGCAGIPEERKGAATGAGVGAATGAAAGALLGSKGAKTETAIIGGLVGALVGGAIGHYTYDQRRTRQETARKYNYQPTLGTQVRIEDASAVPGSVRPGDTVSLKATYAVLTPSPDTTVTVTETREIRRGGELIGRPEASVTRAGGTYTSSVPLILPSTAQSGTYTVITTVQSGTMRDARETRFTVR
ncbi:MAG: hypothetical protein K8I29_18015 [Alphaproteobacteria bacterium]|uniref:YMGG-like Gly-zipper domain-containing protein n=1 Tax=Candidatus Nitrobium versatile TaxID=2884831 RepID=A0A953SHL1_9BACT|nr:hypothetical protein [Candidatus Nitrobium versatile]